MLNKNNLKLKLNKRKLQIIVQKNPKFLQYLKIKKYYDILIKQIKIHHQLIRSIHKAISSLAQ